MAGKPTAASNQLYIKSVSSIATEQSVKDFFRQVPLLNKAEDDAAYSGLMLSLGQQSTAVEGQTAADDIVTVRFIK